MLRKFCASGPNFIRYLLVQCIIGAMPHPQVSPLYQDTASSAAALDVSSVLHTASLALHLLHRAAVACFADRDAGQLSP